MHIAFVIPSSYYCKQHCISAAEPLRCCVIHASCGHHTFVMSNTSLVRTLVPSTCYPSSCYLTRNREWHESAHQDVRPEHVWDRNSQTKTALNLGGNATISNNSCTSLLICHSAYSACHKTTRFLQKIQYYLRHTFVILSQKHCISAAQTLRCCVHPSSRRRHSFVMSNTLLVRTLVPSTCYHPSSCLRRSWEWHESAHKYFRPEHG